MNEYMLRRRIVKGYDIGMNNDCYYVPVPDRDVRTFAKWQGSVVVYNPKGKKVIRISNWDDNVKTEKFQDKYGRGEYQIGYFLLEESYK